MSLCLIIFLGVGVFSTSGKVYTSCELADELIRLKVPKEQVSTWVCIARHESNFNTSAVGRLNWDGSEDHGLFQISDKFWCSPPGSACGVECSSLEDDDIADDWKCARRIYRQHKILQGDGFRAWAVYPTHCSGDTSSYIAECPLQSQNEVTKYAVALWPVFIRNPWTTHTDYYSTFLTHGGYYYSRY